MLKLVSQRTDEAENAQQQKQELETALRKAQKDSELLSSKVKDLTEELVSSQLMNQTDRYMILIVHM
jgi:uncharacterized protein YlxW (UPF0749 family)